MAFTKIGYGQVEPNQLSGIKTGQIFASLPLDSRETSAVEVLQNGEFMFYDYNSGCVTANPATDASITEAFLVYNEVKIYEDWLSYKDFAIIRLKTVGTDGKTHLTDNYVTSAPAVGRVTSVNASVVNGANVTKSPYGDGALNIGADLDAHTEYGYRMDGVAVRLVKTNVGDIFTTNMLEEGDTITYAKGDVLGLKKTARNTLELSKDTTLNTLGVCKFVIAKVYTMPDGQLGYKVQRIS